MDRKITYESSCKSCNWVSEQTTDIDKVHQAETLHANETGHYRMEIFKTLMCECGRGVGLDYFTNECECGREYNSCGQLLAPQSQYEEDYYEEV